MIVNKCAASNNKTPFMVSLFLVSMDIFTGISYKHRITQHRATATIVYAFLRDANCDFVLYKTNPYLLYATRYPDTIDPWGSTLNAQFLNLLLFTLLFVFFFSSRLAHILLWLYPLHNICHFICKEAHTHTQTFITIIIHKTKKVDR